MYCTLKKRINKKREYGEQEIVYDVSLSQSVRMDGKPRRLTKHLFIMDGRLLGSHIDVLKSYDYWIKHSVKMTVIEKLFPNEFPNLSLEEKKKLVEEAKQIVIAKIKLEHEKQQEERRKEEQEQQKQKEKEDREYKEAYERVFGQSGQKRKSSTKSNPIITVGEMEFFLKQSYRLLSKKYHPDVYKDGEKFKIIKNCYDFLINEYLS